MWNFSPILFMLCVGPQFSKAQNDLHATIKSLHVTSDIKYRYATTRVSAEYINDFNSPVTADFHVTLPARAYVSNFSMTVDGNVTYGVVKKKEEAKAIYDKAVAQGQSTGYVEVKHRFTNVYDISVNVEPGKNVLFNLTYQELLQRSLGKYRHVIHLINKEIINDFLVEVFIHEPQDIIDVEIPKIKSDKLESAGEGTQELEGAAIEYIDNKNVYIRYNPSTEEQREFGNDGIEGLFKVNYDVDRKGNPNMVYAVDGYFVHFYAPDSLDTLPKNIVFMLDISGSMKSRKLDQLKQAMITILNSLQQDVDSFLIGVFSDRVRWMNDAVFMPATKNNTVDAIREIIKLHIEGWTNINDALLESIEKLNSVQSSETKNVLFFLTDGQASKGVTNSDMIRDNVKKANTDSVSFFMLGFGDDANNQFLKQVAKENGGFSRKIYEAADSQLQIEGLYNEIANILLKDIDITYLDQEIDSESLSPTNFSSYFRGSEICMTGQLAPEYQQDEMTVQMTMTDLHGEMTVRLKLDLVNLTSETMSNSPNLTNLNSLSEITRNTWVYLTLKKLFKEERTENITEEIIALALKYGFVTPLTSMVVTKSNLVGRVQEEEDDSEVGRKKGKNRSAPPSHGYRGRVFPVHYKPIYIPPVTHTMKARTTTPTPRTTTTTPPPRTTTPGRTTTVPHTNRTREINFMPGILLDPLGCNETLCLGSHHSCLTHTRVLLLADSHAYIYIFGYLVKPSGSNCMEALNRLVIKKKRKILAEITPEMMTKNQKMSLLKNKNEVVLNVKKYLKLKVYIKTVDNVKALSVHFTVLQPLPSPKGILGMYMSNVVCQKKGPNYLVVDNKPDLYQKVTYGSTDSDHNQCFMYSS